MCLGIIGGNFYIDFFILGVVELLGVFLILLIIECFGWCFFFVVSNIVVGVVCFVIVFLLEGIVWLRIIVVILGRLGIIMVFEIVYLVNLELYLIILWNFGVLFCLGLCDFGGIIVLFLFFWLVVVWLELFLIIFGILVFICGGFVMFLFEIKGIVLLEIVDDVEKFGSLYFCKCGRNKKILVFCFYFWGFW